MGVTAVPSSPSGGFTAAANDVVAHLQKVAPLVRWQVVRHGTTDANPEAEADAGGDAGADAGARPFAELRAPRVPIGTCFGVAIRQPNGQLAGALWGMHPSPRPGQLGEILTLAQPLVRVLGQVVAAEQSLEWERTRAERAERRAVTDALTGVTNRRGWEEALTSEEARANRRGLRTGLISLDLDDLKEVNDRAGHAAGDRLLVAAARSLTSVLRREDVLARTGGDEFAVLVVDCDDECLDHLVARLRSALNDVRVRASVGAVHVPAGSSLREAWQRADQRMYAEKRRDPGRAAS
jgi:diguanylate cyclase (GGDEF)-like protein